MQRDDEFTPKLGKIRTRALPRRTFLRDVQNAVARTRTSLERASASKRRFDGSRIGRGAGIGRVLKSGDRFGSLRGRRVVIKARLIRLGGGLSAAKAHLRYLERDGVTREGNLGGAYSAGQDRADVQGLLARSDGDRHQFRFIVSAEDAIEYSDLKPLTRRLMLQVEQDLGTKLDWIAVDHYNTGHPHTHIVLRGKDDKGKDLIIAREYLSRGMRERAAELVNLDLGPRTDHEIQSRLQQEVEQERFTSLDRSLVREADPSGLVRSGHESDTFRQTLRAGRLQKLRRLGLAEEVSPAQWRLSSDLEAILRRMGERGDIIKTLHHDLARTKLKRGLGDLVVHEPGESDGRLVGRVISRGLVNELSDRHYLVVDAVDGRIHHLEIGQADAVEPTPEGAIVAVTPREAKAKRVDHTVASVAADNGGRYSADLHLAHEPSTNSEFVNTHIRRLEAMRRAGLGVEREAGGTWIIAPDHLDKALRYEQMLLQKTPVRVEVLSTLRLEGQVHAEGETWLDRELISSVPVALRDSGFGQEARAAAARRRQWLIEHELASEQQGTVVYRANMLRSLRERELQRIGGQLSAELGLAYMKPAGQRVEGVFRRRLDLVSGRYALIENAREFTLVPWRPVLERNLGRHVAGVMNSDGGISWTLGRQRGPAIS